MANHTHLITTPIEGMKPMNDETFDKLIEEMKILFTKLPRSDDGQTVVFDDATYGKCITYIWDNFVRAGTKFFRRVPKAVIGYRDKPATCFLQLADCVEFDINLVIQTIAEMIKRKDDGGSIPKAHQWFLDLHSDATRIRVYRDNELSTVDLNPFESTSSASGSVMMVGGDSFISTSADKLTEEEEFLQLSNFMAINRVYRTTDGKNFGVRFRLSNVLFTSCSDEMLNKIYAAAKAWIRESHAHGGHDHLAYQHHNDIVSCATDILSERLVDSLMPETRKVNDSEMSNDTAVSILQLSTPALFECMGRNATGYTFTYRGHQLPLHGCHLMVLQKLEKVITEELERGKDTSQVAMSGSRAYFEGAIKAIKAVPVIR